MVLIRSLFISPFASLFFSLLLVLNGCGTLSNLQSNPQSKTKIIPVQTRPEDNPRPINNQTDKLENEVKSSERIDIKSENLSDPEASDKLPLSNLPLNSVVDNLLEKAQKAFSLQQWLRVQRILEQAMRLQADRADIYTIYGDLYAQLGVPDQAENMYRRALSLSHKDDGSYTQILAKLKQILNQSN